MDRGTLRCVRVVWTAGALIVGAYLGYAVVFLLLHATGADTASNVTNIAGGCGFVFGLLSARMVWQRQS